MDRSFAPALPPGHRVYAIGDIHGRADLLEELHAAIARDGATAPPGTQHTLVYLGDYVDRGQDSRGVLDLLIEAPLRGFVTVHLKGNHEDAMQRFLSDPKLGPAWFAIGGDATVLSYGVGLPAARSQEERFALMREDLRARIPAAHLDFLNGLALAYEAGDYVFVHAGLRPGASLEEQDPDDLIWLRDSSLEWGRDFGRVVVHGHSTSYEPIVRPHQIGIDTGAYATNVLTCVVLEGDERRFLATAGT